MSSQYDETLIQKIFGRFSAIALIIDSIGMQLPSDDAHVSDIAQDQFGHRGWQCVKSPSIVPPVAQQWTCRLPLRSPQVKNDFQRHLAGSPLLINLCFLAFPLVANRVKGGSDHVVTNYAQRVFCQKQIEHDLSGNNSLPPEALGPAGPCREPSPERRVG